MRLLSTTRFTRDVKRAKRRGKDLDKLWAIVDTLLLGEDLASRHRPHQLSGRWSSHWECHIESDWLLVWSYRDETLVLARTGTHADLFG